MKTVTFVSHYFQTELKIRLTDGKYNSLMSNKHSTPLELYLLDDYRVLYGKQPKYFSSGQIKKLQRALTGIEYWDNII